MPSAVTEGWLFKHATLGLVPTRHARYCILIENELKYYKHKADLRPHGVLDLNYYMIAEKDSGKHHPYGFRVVAQSKHHRSYLFYADHEKECQHWIEHINDTINFLKKGQYDTLEAAFPPPMDDSYSVLDKWLNRLDLNDNSPIYHQHHHQQRPLSPVTRINSPPPLVHSPPSKSNKSGTTVSSLSTYNTHQTSPLASSPSPISPNSRPCRISTDSLDSLPSEITSLSSSAGSRPYMGQNIILYPTTNNNPGNSIDQQLSSQACSFTNSQQKPPSSSSSSSLNKRHSNPISFVSRSLSNLKNQHGIRHYNNQQQSPTGSYDSMTTSASSISNNKNNCTINTPNSSPRKDWQPYELFHFEDDMVAGHSKLLYKDSAPDNSGTSSPPLSHGF
ncbi:hypothetical protein BC941DRAFT_47267 [Chlamydoabsidia padenii]|nr:hypothetical protein BC941DRAFT_47267 [Chlamydoabsidia padenii]